MTDAPFDQPAYDPSIERLFQLLNDRLRKLTDHFRRIDCPYVQQQGGTADASGDITFVFGPFRDNVNLVRIAFLMDDLTATGDCVLYQDAAAPSNVLDVLTNSPGGSFAPPEGISLPRDASLLLVYTGGTASKQVGARIEWTFLKGDDDGKY